MFQPLTKEQYNSAVSAGFSPQQIIDMEKKRKEQKIEKAPNYFQRVAKDYTSAGENIKAGIQQGADVLQQGLDNKANPLQVAGGLLRTGLRTVGGVAGAAFAPITEAPGIKQGIGAIGTGISKIPGVDNIVKQATLLAQKHPESAKDIQNIIDIATLGVGSGATKTAGTALEKTGVALEKSGVASADVAKAKFAQELVSPVETAAVKLEQVKRTTESSKLFKKDIITPTAFEAQQAKEVAQIPGVSPKNTYQQNFNLVRDYNVSQAKQLESDVAKYDFVIPKKEVIYRLDAVSNSLSKDNPLIVGDAEKTAQKLIAGAKKIIQENEGKGSGLLKARKEYDSWVLSQKPKAFDAKAENAFTVANTAIRNELNTILDENAVNLGVKDSLRKQSALYSAMDSIAPKAAAEANTPLLRAFERVGKVLGVKSRLVQAVATAAGIGGLGAAATFAPAVAITGGVGFVIYRAGKLVMKPEVRIAIGRLLQTSGKLLNPTDRALLQNALNAYKE